MKVEIEVRGETMEAELLVPERTAGNNPGVLLCPGLTRDIEGLSFLSDAFVALGYTVLAIRYRGMDLRSDSEDCHMAIAYLARFDGVDPNRIGLVGHSRGSMAGLQVAATDPILKAVVAVQPVTDFLTYVRATRIYAPTRFERLTSVFGGADPDVEPAPYQEYAAINYADRIEIPVLLVAGTNDLHSPSHHSVMMHDALVEAGNSQVDLHILDGVGHFFETAYEGRAHDDLVNVVGVWLRDRL